MAARLRTAGKSPPQKMHMKVITMERMRKWSLLERYTGVYEATGWPTITVVVLCKRW